MRKDQVTFTDGTGNPIEMTRIEPVARVPVTTPTADKASLVGVTFHRQPCGSYVATAGRRRVCGSPERVGTWSQEEADGRSKELVAGVMLGWLA